MIDVPIVWINGELSPHDEVCISPFDLGLSVGLGVFETMISYRGNVVFLPSHYERLKESVKLLKLKVPSYMELADAADGVLRANGLTKLARARVRITVGTGERPLYAKKYSRFVEDYVIVSAVPEPVPAASAQLMLVPMICNEKSAIAGIKSTSYAGNVLAYRHAVSAGADEAVMLNTQGKLCECSMSNIFLVKGGKVLTPGLDSGCLPGVTRKYVITACRALEVTVEECDLTERDLRDADEIFITSSAREVQPAKMLGVNVEIPGKVTASIANYFQGMIEMGMES